MCPFGSTRFQVLDVRSDSFPSFASNCDPDLCSALPEQSSESGQGSTSSEEDSMEGSGTALTSQVS